MFAVLLLVCLLGFASSQESTDVPSRAPTQHGNHNHHGHHYTGPSTTREPSEHAGFKFVYDPRSHHMVIIEHQTCYIFTLTAAERVAVHSDAGITQLELKMLQMLNTATLSPTTKDALAKSVAGTCGHHITTIYTVA